MNGRFILDQYHTDELKVSREASRLLKSIANESRLLILFKLSIKPMTVAALNEYIKISQSGLSQHLSMLRLAKIIESRRHGTSVEYTLVNQDIKEIIKTLQSFCGYSAQDIKYDLYRKTNENYADSVNDSDNAFNAKKK